MQWIKTFWVFHNSSMCSLLVFGLEFSHVQRFFSFWKGYFYLIKFHSHFHFNCPSSNLFQKIGQSICKRGRQGGVKENLFWLMCTPITDLTHAGHWNIRKAKKETNKHSDEAPPVVFLHKAIPQRLRIFSFIYIHIWWFHVFLNCHNLRLCFMYQIIKKKKNKKQASQSSNTQTYTMEHKAIFPQCLRICSSIHIRVWQSQFFFKGCHNLRLCITQNFGHGAENKSKDSCKYSAMF